MFDRCAVAFIKTVLVLQPVCAVCGLFLVTVVLTVFFPLVLFCHHCHEYNPGRDLVMFH